MRDQKIMLRSDMQSKRMPRKNKDKMKTRRMRDKAEELGSKTKTRRMKDEAK